MRRGENALINKARTYGGWAKERRDTGQNRGGLVNLFFGRGRNDADDNADDNADADATSETSDADATSKTSDADATSKTSDADATSETSDATTGGRATERRGGRTDEARRERFNQVRRERTGGRRSGQTTGQNRRGLINLFVGRGRNDADDNADADATSETSDATTGGRATGRRRGPNAGRRTKLTGEQTDKLAPAQDRGGNIRRAIETAATGLRAAGRRVSGGQAGGRTPRRRGGVRRRQRNQETVSTPTWPRLPSSGVRNDIATRTVTVQSSANNNDVVNAPTDPRGESDQGSQAPSGDNTRIVGGTTADDGEYPWQVAMFIRRRRLFVRSAPTFHCGGVLISDRHILTAAHCTEGLTTGRRGYDIFVRIGTNQLRDRNAPLRQVLRFTQHANYVSATIDNDISMLLLSDPVTFTDLIQPINLSTTDTNDLVGQSTTVTGWGTTMFDGSISTSLQEVVVVVTSDATCQEKYGSDSIITNSMVCAGDLINGGKDACQGDSGGPMVRIDDSGTTVLVGLVSWGAECALADYPGVYTDVEYLSSWIADTQSALT
ncbi:PREDICTED: transmembrane protease serine 11D-like [Priapulus caudatus]|uniref:Transmembrane protease serine 11D-like n=1 Tax=Priapulus caudatus TaxID=37621 RepID=A0ABM1FBN1_PRICU|nr:PREDICTED: transmembrane protease serine 11D-like [Priapulus caudatus]